MNSYSHGAARCALALAAWLIVSVSARSQESIPWGTLSGAVVGPDGKPVAGARVWTDTYNVQSSQKETLVEARTDAAGRFRLGPVKPFYRNSFELIVEAEGLARLSILGGVLTVYPGADHDLGTLTLDYGRVFTGQVADADGKPYKGATVTPGVQRFYQGHTVGDIGPEITLTTDAEGRFRTPPLPVGRLALYVRAPERQLRGVYRTIPPGGAEDLGMIRLENDVPVTGAVKDEEGNPIPEAKIGGTYGFETITDADGKFTLRGFGPNPTFQLNVSRPGYTVLIGRVTIDDEGIRYVHSGNDFADQTPAKELTVILKRAGWIEGQALDAETGEPVRLNRIVVCTFERKPNGEVVLRGCRMDGFEQPEPGRFRVSFPAPDEYHLTFSADGYHDGEAYTPKVADLATIRGIVARMRKKTDDSNPAVAQQTLSGVVTRDGRPVASGWVALWALRKPANAVNAPVLRGRTAVGDPIRYASAPIRNGAYTLDVPFQSDAWYVVAEEAGHPLTQVGPLAVALNEKKTLSIACQEGGSIRGRVAGVPAGWEGHVWVVAFTKTAIREETRVDATGRFRFSALPPGEYGLKVGHDAYLDPEAYPGDPRTLPLKAFEETADPWKRAKVVTVEPGRELSGIEVEFPAP